MFPKRKSYSISERSLENPENGSTENDNNGSTKIIPLAKNNPLLGVFYTFITSLLLTLTSVFVKKLAHINTGQLSFVRNAGVFAGCLPIAIYSVREVIGPKQHRCMLLIRGVIGATGLYLHLLAFRYLPLAVAAVILSTTPVLTTFLAYIYLKEACGLVQCFVLALTVVGVLLSVRLPELLSNKSDTHFDYTYAGGLASSVAAVLFLSVMIVTLRKIKDIHFSVPLLYLGIFGMAENAIISSVTSTLVYPECGLDQIMVMLIGIFGFMGHCTLTLAVQKQAAGIVSVLKASLDIVVAMVFQLIFFDESLDIYNISGACLVIISVSILGVRNWLHMLPEDSKIKKRLKCLLF